MYKQDMTLHTTFHNTIYFQVTYDDQVTPIIIFKGKASLLKMYVMYKKHHMSSLQMSIPLQS